MRHAIFRASMLLLLSTPNVFALSEAQIAELNRSNSLFVTNETGTIDGQFTVAFEAGSEPKGEVTTAMRAAAYPQLTELGDKRSSISQKICRVLNAGFSFVNKETHQDGLASIGDDFEANRKTEDPQWGRFVGATTVRVVRTALAVLFGTPYSIAAPILGKAWTKVETSAASCFTDASKPATFVYEWDGQAWDYVPAPVDPHPQARLTVRYSPFAKIDQVSLSNAALGN